MEYFTTAGGITVHLYDTEDKPENNVVKKTVVLLHGYLETMYIWQQLTEKLQDKYRVIVMDLPGHGLTDSAPADEKGRIINSMDFCADTVKALMDKINVREAYIAGHSMGGYIALICVHKYPELFKKLVLMNITPYSDLEDKNRNVEREISVIRSGKLETLAYISIPGMYYKENLRKFDDKIRETIELCEMHFPEGIIGFIYGMHSRSDISSYLEETDIPVMSICGDYDPFIPVQTFEEMKNKFKKIQFHLIKGTGHNSFIEAEEETVDKLCGFFG